MRKPDFSQLETALRGGRPDRAVFFEFVVASEHLLRLPGGRFTGVPTPEGRLRDWIEAYRIAGFDFATIPVWDVGLFSFPSIHRDHMASVGMARGGIISDRPSFEAYPWPDPETGDWEMLDRVGNDLPDGMRLIALANGGVLENAISLVGYEDLCYLMADDPALAKDLFEAIGSRILRLYEIMVERPWIGAAFVNDDWGFRSQGFFPPESMREYVFPWTKKIIETIRRAGKPSILHSCGNLETLWNDILNDLRPDAKHSYEDTIMPVEEAYERFVGKIGVVGGIDLDFLCRSDPRSIRKRCEAMLERSAGRGGYALGSGNSIPAYIPFESFMAMRDVALSS